jgi:hypothetical protein
MQGDVFPASHPPAQLQAIQSIQSPDPLPIDQPALTPEQYPDPQVAKPRPSLREIPNANS